MRATLPAPHPARPLGGNERAFWKLSEASSLTIAMIAHVRPGLDATAVRRALVTLQSRHPLLRAQIELRDGKPWFVWPSSVSPIPPIPVHQREVSRQDWQAVVEQEMRAGVPWQQAPMARALLLDHADAGATLVLFFHHAIADGMAAIAAMRDVLWESVTGVPVSTTHFERSRAAESSLPPRARGLRGGLRRVGILASLASSGKRHRDPVTCPVDAVAAPHERTFHVEPRAFDAATTSALAARARAVGSSLQGAIGAAMIFGVARAAGVAGERTVTLGSPINVRGRLSPPIGAQMGMYLAVSHFQGTVSPTTRLWDLARAVRQRIAEDIDTGRAVDALPLIELFYRSLGGDKVSAQEYGRRWAATNGTTGVTNIGKIDIDAPPGLEIERVHAFGFPSGLDVFNAVASSYNGSLLLSFNWPEPNFRRASVMPLIDDVVATLRAAADGDPVLGSSSPRSSSGGH